jgi:hypothetical protein
MAKSQGRNGQPVPVPRFYYDPAHDVNDGKPWSEMDIADLKRAAQCGNSLAETAAFLCRSGTPGDVAAKAADLGLTFKQ